MRNIFTNQFSVIAILPFFIIANGLILLNPKYYYFMQISIFLATLFHMFYIYFYIERKITGLLLFLNFIVVIFNPIEPFNFKTENWQLLEVISLVIYLKLIIYYRDRNMFKKIEENKK